MHCVMGHETLPHLSARELEVLIPLAMGLTKAQTGLILNISRFTVDFHTRRILSKLDVPNITAAVYRAVSLGVLPPYDHRATQKLREDVVA